jgi:uncharacterized protein
MSEHASRQDAAPVIPANRHAIIDIVRGFALLGVLLSNLVWVALWCGTPNELLEALPTHGIDELVDLFGLTFIQSKFYTLFSMLFGLGLAIQLNSAERRGGSVAPTYLRRLGVLFVIGALHATLIWFGDILILYAINGVILLALSRFPVKILLRLALALAIFTSLLPAIQWQIHAGTSPNELSAAAAAEEVDPLYEVMRDASYAEVVRAHLDFQIDAYSNTAIAGDESMLFWYLNVLWKFILGFCIGRMGILQNLAAHRAAIRRLFPWALGIGIAGNALGSAIVAAKDVWIPSAYSWLSLLNVPYELGIVSLAVAYACGLCLLVERAKSPRWVAALAPVGRMALTNYLMQSVFYLAIFYQLGFGAIGKIGATSCMAIGAVIFLGQVAFSRWWLNRFRFGPAEWAWRSLTYGKMQPMRLKP